MEVEDINGVIADKRRHYERQYNDALRTIQRECMRGMAADVSNLQAQVDLLVEANTILDTLTTIESELGI
jgi:hypothetical protein